MNEHDQQAITVYFPRDFIATLDEQVAARRKDRPLAPISRSSIVRELVERGMKKAAR